jgi:hypothetical protein
LSDLKNKNYLKPKGNQVYNEMEHIHSHGDLVPLDGFKAFILPRNELARTPEPSYDKLAISDARVFYPGDRILIDCVNNTSALRVVKKKDGRTIYLKDRLNHLPKIGGDVFKIVAQSSTLIDTRFDLSKEEHKEFLDKRERKLRS